MFVLQQSFTENFFFEISDKKYEKIYQRCKDMKNVNYLGYQKHEEIIKLLQQTHIFAYPSCWIETSCISAIEAMAAGCQVVTSNLGALYETCAPFGTLVGFDRNFYNLEKKYSKALLKSIKNYWSEENQEHCRFFKVPTAEKQENQRFFKVWPEGNQENHMFFKVFKQKFFLKNLISYPNRHCLTKR